MSTIDSNQKTQEDQWLEILDICKNEDENLLDSFLDTQTNTDIANKINKNSLKPLQKSPQKLSKKIKSSTTKSIQTSRQRNKLFQTVGTKQKAFDDFKFLIDGLCKTLPENTRCLSLCQMIPKFSDPLIFDILIEHKLLSKVYRRISQFNFEQEPNIALCVSAFICLQIYETGSLYSYSSIIDLILSAYHGHLHPNFPPQEEIMSLVPAGVHKLMAIFPKTSYSLHHTLLITSLFLLRSAKHPKYWKFSDHDHKTKIISILCKLINRKSCEVRDSILNFKNGSVQDYFKSELTILEEALELIFQILESFPIAIDPSLLCDLTKTLRDNFLLEMPQDMIFGIHLQKLSTSSCNFWINILNILTLIITKNDQQNLSSMLDLPQPYETLSCIIFQLPTLILDHLHFDILLTGLVFCWNILDKKVSFGEKNIVENHTVLQNHQFSKIKFFNSLISMLESLLIKVQCSQKSVDDEIMNNSIKDCKQSVKQISSDSTEISVKKLCELAGQNMEVSICAAHVSMILACIWSQESNLYSEIIDVNTRKEFVSQMFLLIDQFFWFLKLTMPHMDTQRIEKLREFVEQQKD